MANGNGDKLFNPTPGIGLEEQEEELDGPLMLQGRGVADQWPPEGAIIAEESVTEDREWPPKGAVIDEESIVDGVTRKAAERKKIEEEKAAAKAANASKYSQEQIDQMRTDISAGKIFDDEGFLKEDIYDTAKTDEEADARIAEAMKVVNAEQLKLDNQKADEAKYKKEASRNNLTTADYQLGEDEAVEALTAKYKGTGVSFSVASDWTGKDKITVTGPEGSKDFLLGSKFNLASGQFGAIGDGTKEELEAIKSSSAATYQDMIKYIDSQTKGPDVEQTELQQVMDGQGPVMDDNRSIEQKINDY